VAEYRDILKELLGSLRTTLENTTLRLKERGADLDEELIELVEGTYPTINRVEKALDITEDESCAPMAAEVRNLNVVRFSKAFAENINKGELPKEEEARQVWYWRFLGGIANWIEGMHTLLDKLAELGSGTPVGGPLKNLSKVLAMLARAIASRM
jgi:hypothetical protein